MQREQEDRFVVFVRAERDPERPDANERAFTYCTTYADAQRIRKGLHLIGRDSVVRFEGQTGGGD